MALACRQHECKIRIIVSSISFPFETPPAEGEAIEIADGVLWIRLPLPLALDHVNVYALRHDDGWVIVDTGFHTRRGIKIWEKLLATPLRGEPVHQIILTHYHPDHIGAAGWLAEHLNAEIVASRTTWLYARMLTLNVQEKTPEKILDYYRAAGMNGDIYESCANNRPFNFADIVAPLGVGYIRLQNDQEITFGHRKWKVITGDGHAPEHLTFHSLDDDLIIAGDQILPGISPNITVHPTEILADPLDEWLQSCATLQTHVDNDRLILGGHKLPFRGGKLRLQQLIDNHANSLKRLLDYLETPRLAGQCFDILFKRKIGAAEYTLALGEALAHLNYLYLRGKISRDIDQQGLWWWQRI